MTTTVISSNRRNDERRGHSSSCPLTVEQLIRQLSQILANANVAMSPSKISRLVRTYRRDVEPNGFPFIDFVVNNVQMSTHQARVVADEYTRAIAYADPVGELATHRVDRDPKELERRARNRARGGAS